MCAINDQGEKFYLFWSKNLSDKVAIVSFKQNIVEAKNYSGKRTRLPIIPETECYDVQLPEYLEHGESMVIQAIGNIRIFDNFPKATPGLDYVPIDKVFTCNQVCETVWVKLCVMNEDPTRPKRGEEVAIRWVPPPRFGVDQQIARLVIKKSTSGRMLRGSEQS